MEAIEDDRQLRAMVALIDAQAEQIATLRSTVERLEGMLALRAELDAMVAHEVRTPLTVVHGVLVTLGMLAPEHPDRPALMRQALDHTRRLSDAVKHLLVPSGEVPATIARSSLDAVAFDGVADRALDEVARHFPTAGVVLDLAPDLIVTTDASRLEALLVHVVEHACERSGNEAIELRARRVHDQLRVEVADRGGPLPPEGDEAVGLYLARMLARSLGGDITVGERSDGGCVAMIELPQRRGDDSPNVRT